MALRLSVIDVPIDDSKFRRFQELFQKYSEQLAKTPGIWQQAGKAQSENVKVAQMMTASMMAQAEHMREIAAAEREQQRHLTVASRLWTGIAGSARTVAGSVMHATVSLVKWAGLLGAAGGLLGLGGLYGIDRMAGEVGEQRRSAMGLGMSIGSMKAFGTDFGRVVSPESFLGGILQMRTNPALSGALWALGVNPGGSETQVALATLNALRVRAKATPDSQLGLILQSLPGLQGVSIEDLERMKRMGTPEWMAQMAHFRRDRSALNIADPTAAAWQNFSSQMQRAGQTVFKVFVQGLQPLEKPLEGLSKSFVHVLQVLLSKNGIIEQGINEFAGWLDKFNGKISKPAFLKSLESFASDVGSVAQAIHAVANAIANPKLTAYGAGLGGPPSMMEAGMSQPRSPNFSAFLAAVEKRNLLPAGVMEKLMMAESSDHSNVTNTVSGAQGLFQLMPATSKYFGVNPFDPVQNADAAGRLLGTYYAKYNGDLEKAIAAYGGLANADKLFAKHPKDWQSRLSARAVRNGLAREEYALTRDRRFLVQINNATGGAAHVTVNGLAQ